MFERLFKLKEFNTSIRQEVTAGLATFAAMAYILAVNPAILQVTGMDVGALISATALSAAVMTAVMALATNYPIALAPGMGMNAFFAYTICVAMKMPWQAALAMTFLSGGIFMVLSVTGLRRLIFEAIPHQIKIAISCGIGLFIIFIGLKNGGIIVGDPNTYVTAGKLSEPSVMLSMFGIIVAAWLFIRKIRGAVILTVLLITVIGLFIPAGDGKLTMLPENLVAMPASLAPTAFKLDFAYVFSKFHKTFPLILAILFVDLFDNMGTMIGVCHRAGILDAQGNIPKLKRVLSADAGAAMFGSLIGTSTVTSYIESTAGVEEGGRTGLTALTVSVCFLLALFLHPLIRIIPSAATAPALIIVGIFMLQGIRELEIEDFAVAVPSFLIIFLMPLTVSISEGLAIGFVVYVSLMLLLGRAKGISLVSFVLAGIFLLHLLLR